MHEFDKCMVFHLEGAKAAEGFVHECHDGVIKIYTQGTSQSLVTGEEVLIFIYNSVKGECRYRGKVEKASFNRVEIAGAALVSSLQQRENTRVNKQLKYRISYSFNEKGERVKLDRPIDIIILNVSAQGMYFNCVERFEVGFAFALIFRETLRPVHLKVKILRREDYSGNYNYGCIFPDVSSKDMDEIFRFVLREQIAQRRKSLMG